MQSDSITELEVWRPVVGYEGVYSVSDLGRVRRDEASTNTRPGRILSGIVDKDGYLMVNLSRQNTARRRKVHRLVLEAFVGPCPDEMEACHFPDRTRSNNRLANLRWDTRKANWSDSVAHGRLSKSA